MPDEARVRLIPMTTEQYDAWAVHSTAAYAENLARATARTLAAARLRARAIFQQLMPDGLETEGTSLLVVVDEDDTPVGTLWLGPHPAKDGAAYVWDLEIAEGHRHRGLGRAAMLAAEQYLLDAGHTEVGLSVFGFNEPARRLYDSLGYGVVVTEMLKDLGSTPTTGS